MMLIYTTSVPLRSISVSEEPPVAWKSCSVEAADIEGTSMSRIGVACSCVSSETTIARIAGIIAIAIAVLGLPFT